MNSASALSRTRSARLPEYYVGYSRISKHGHPGAHAQKHASAAERRGERGVCGRPQGMRRVEVAGCGCGGGDGRRAERQEELDEGVFTRSEVSSVGRAQEETRGTYSLTGGPGVFVPRVRRRAAPMARTPRP